MSIEAVAGLAFVAAQIATLVWITVEQRRANPSRVYRALGRVFDAMVDAIYWTADQFRALVLRRTS